MEVSREGAPDVERVIGEGVLLPLVVAVVDVEVTEEAEVDRELEGGGTVEFLVSDPFRPKDGTKGNVPASPKA
jgi:hypothetical protein